MGGGQLEGMLISRVFEDLEDDADAPPPRQQLPGQDRIDLPQRPRKVRQHVSSEGAASGSASARVPTSAAATASVALAIGAASSSNAPPLARAELVGAGIARPPAVPTGLKASSPCVVKLPIRNGCSIVFRDGTQYAALGTITAWGQA